MSKFTFYNHDDEGTISATSFEVDTWIEVLDKFVLFLRGCGYALDNDSVMVNLNNHPFADSIYTENITYISNED